MRTFLVVGSLLALITGCAAPPDSTGPSLAPERQTGAPNHGNPNRTASDDSRPVMPDAAAEADEQSRQEPSQARVVEEDDGQWRPDWYFPEPSRTPSGAVQACGKATNADLLSARRAAIEHARSKAMEMADAGMNEQVIQAATHPDASGAYTVWVKLQVGG